MCITSKYGRRNKPQIFFSRKTFGFAIFFFSKIVYEPFKENFFMHFDGSRLYELFKFYRLDEPVLISLATYQLAERSLN